MWVWLWIFGGLFVLADGQVVKTLADGLNPLVLDKLVSWINA
jgi:hypothetical protein